MARSRLYVGVSCERQECSLFFFQGVSNVFLAELADPAASASKLPKVFALKVAVDRTHRYVAHHTIERIEATFESQHALGRAARHPLIADIFSDATPQGYWKYELISEAGVMTVGKLQELASDACIEAAAKARCQVLPLPFLRYLAAQLCLAVDHLHSKGFCWGDPQHNNIIVMSDFTMRLIDVHEADGVVDQQKRDLEMLAGLLYNLVTGDPDFLFKDTDWLLERFESCRTAAPLLFEMLEQLLAEKCVCKIYSAKFWTTHAVGSGIDLASIRENNIFSGSALLKRAAWESLGKDMAELLKASGVDGS